MSPWLFEIDDESNTPIRKHKPYWALKISVSPNNITMNPSLRQSKHSILETMKNNDLKYIWKRRPFDL